LRLQVEQTEADTSSMDVLGAKMLAARLRAGVRIGQVIELLDDSSGDARLKRGDIGVVRGFSDGGLVVIQWSEGFVEEIDPSIDGYRPHAA